MAQPSSTAPDEEMRSPLPKPRRFARSFWLIIFLSFFALCSVSLGSIAYALSAIRLHTSSSPAYSFPHLQAPGLRALPVTDLEKRYNLSIIATLPAAGPERAARILLSARSDHDQALYSIDTDGRNLQRLPETLPCDGAFMFTPDARELTCKQWFMVYPFDPVTLRVTGEMTLIDPVINLAIWGPDSHQFVTSSVIGADRGVSFYRADATYSSITPTAILLFNNAPIRLSLMSWSPDGRYLLFRGPALDGSFRDQLFLLPLATIQKRLLAPTSTPWSPGTPVAEIQSDDLVSIALPGRAQAYTAVWRPDGSSLTVIGGDAEDIDPQHVLTMVSLPTGETSLLVMLSNWPPHEFSYIGYVIWTTDNRLVF